MQALFELLGTARDQGLRIRSSDFLYTLRCVAEGRADDLREIYRNPLIIKLKLQSIVPKTLNQKRFPRSPSIYSSRSCEKTNIFML